MEVIVKCDRCGRQVRGSIEAQGTGGFYWVRPGSQWKRYCSPHEEVVCEACMWRDPGYMIDHGPRNNQLN